MSVHSHGCIGKHIGSVMHFRVQNYIKTHREVGITAFPMKQRKIPLAWAVFDKNIVGSALCTKQYENKCETIGISSQNQKTASFHINSYVHQENCGIL